MEQMIAKVSDLRRTGQAMEARELLLKALEQEPKEAELWYQTAWTHDVLGMEREAVPFYEKSLGMALAADSRRGAILGLSSTYRVIGDYAKAKAWLDTGMNEFPDYRPFRVFYAMVLYNLGEHGKAMEGLLMELAETTADITLQEYSRAIQYYADKLDHFEE
ncbi:tetratricopeptide repeat protein [Paenibacillus polymyxa]|uniref:tetratricopeptide repeat protein n=1 Tax=Paenibacillus polymyxa TaxID=1406 RepID=UPI0025B63C21|nr:tetratricopeptide repeat protein [Paenibacillus polymyxa]MDN4083881.1 tetratricopeptide repeat protein [Paenibacillus polymyxa]MDN4087489.1 tetratricopeptide repeat protein [Paenibacillus polymyxa]MDN4109109.1 tetratricopeptide repeat protein [Paenibacillus polymyxa]